jgi:hypothetical protein
MKPTISIPGVSERDVDLLVLEEFVAEPAFRDWLVGHAVGRTVSNAALRSARRSVLQSLGESDLELEVSLDSRLVRILVENKVRAGLQRDQAIRYAKRAQMHVDRGDCHECHVLIMAPATYFGGSGTRGFARRVTYEELIAWFDGNETQRAKGRLNSRWRNRSRNPVAQGLSTFIQRRFPETVR